MNSIVSVDWLKENINDPDLLIFYTALKPILAEFEALRIPHARKFDLKNVFRDLTNFLPNTFPNPIEFQEACRKLGLNNSSKVVIYDAQGIYSAPRAWFLLKSMGLSKVAVLDGGIVEWKRRGLSIVEEELDESYKQGDFVAKLDKQRIITIQDVESNIEQKEFIIIDARSKGRFDGTAPEPRAGLRSGCIPGSINIPFTEVLQNGKIKSSEELKAIFIGKKINRDKVVFSCGSGVTACIVLLAYSLDEDLECSIFDGSWTEWASKHVAPT